MGKSSVSGWSKDIILDGLANSRINTIRRQKRVRKIQELLEEEYSNFSQTRFSSKLLCAMLYWAEGSKKSYELRFVNSDPIMIGTFLQLLRQAYSINENKFKVLVHIHEYHNNNEIKQFWSGITNIPLEQFNKSYLKPHTGINTHPGYKGCVCISYHDPEIALELKALYNMFAQHIRV